MTGTIDPERLAKLNDITLDEGGHKDAADGMCVMEAAAWIAGEKWTDHPSCVSPLLAEFCRDLNDEWDDEQRQRLKPFVTRVIGTAGDGQDEARSYLALDWLVRTYTPAWLDLAGLSAEAAALRGHRRVVDRVAAESIRERVEHAWQSAYAAREAAWAAARAAARAAAGSAAWAAAGEAAWAAARDAARADALAPTVRHLQASALDLLDRMIDPRTSTASRTDEEAKRLKAEREEKARRMHREVTLLFERDPIGRLIAAMLIAREGSDR